ncbi:MAG: pentapeptide repeat-containing protein [Chloroflexi bacterium]|nr:MAG: pentapeptide repeat-containing protein [Chloroflexota bacterium]RLT51717.1 MAG: pentapeptide repeat-containing protein [Chloroflexota bacterium]
MGWHGSSTAADAAPLRSLSAVRVAAGARRERWWVAGLAAAAIASYALLTWLGNEDIHSLARMFGISSLNVRMRNANFSNQNMSAFTLAGADLESANFNGADLSRADLTGAYLRYANFTNANLQGAQLRNAVLTNASLMGADLTGASLRGAYIVDSNLQGAKVTDAQLATARTLRGTLLPDGSTHP